MRCWNNAHYSTSHGSIVVDTRKLQKLKQADFALFACYWWPQADLERASIAAFLIIWLFLWDDEIDDAAGSLTNNFEDSQSFRDETTRYVEQCLGLKNHGLASENR